MDNRVCLNFAMLSNAARWVSAPTLWPHTSVPTTIFFDACLTGVSVVFPDFGFAYFPVRSDCSVHVNFLEFFAAVLAVELAFRLGLNSILLVGDSTTALPWINRGYTTDDMTNMWLRPFLAR